MCERLTLTLSGDYEGRDTSLVQLVVTKHYKIWGTFSVVIRVL